MRLPDATLVEAFADLVFQEGARWTVVDFKTDATIAGRAEPYRRQIALYVQGIAETTGEEARGVLLAI
jgi:ATP-dependent exoDNAse (exonuclease V) beta subunit